MGYKLYRRQKVAVHNLSNVGNVGSINTPNDIHRNDSSRTSSNLLVPQTSSIESQDRRARPSTAHNGSSQHNSSSTHGQLNIWNVRESFNR